MKLITLNVEGLKHEALVFPFIAAENPDVLCLQEAPLAYKAKLEALGYYTGFVPRCKKLDGEAEFIEGVLIASKTEAAFSTHYYYKPTEEIPLERYIPQEERYANHQVFLLATITLEGVSYTIGNNHFTWTPEGNKPGLAQRTDIQTFTDIVSQLTPHVMCGDFNIPRHHNALYENLCALYTDTVPEEYSSSLDRTIHRIGHLPEKQNLFTDYMVDYVFTQPPYSARDVRLEFGVSDHAAVVAHITKN